MRILLKILQNTLFALSLLLPFSLFSEGLEAKPTLVIYPNKAIPFSNFLGKWVLVHYWASWCEHCLSEIPALNQFYEKYKHKDVVLFALNYDLLPQEQAYLLSQKHRIQFPILTHDPADALDLGDIRGVPVTFVFNPEGKLTATLYGEQTVGSLKKAITS